MENNVEIIKDNVVFDIDALRLIEFVEFLLVRQARKECGLKAYESLPMLKKIIFRIQSFLFGKQVEDIAEYNDIQNLLNDQEWIEKKVEQISINRLYPNKNEDSAKTMFAEISTKFNV